jgi:hypothetical protein
MPAAAGLQAASGRCRLGQLCRSGGALRGRSDRYRSGRQQRIGDEGRRHHPIGWCVRSGSGCTVVAVVAVAVLWLAHSLLHADLCAQVYRLVVDHGCVLCSSRGACHAGSLSEEQRAVRITTLFEMNLYVPVLIKNFFAAAAGRPFPGSGGTGRRRCISCFQLSRGCQRRAHDVTGGIRGVCKLGWSASLSWCGIRSSVVLLSRSAPHLPAPAICCHHRSRLTIRIDYQD